MRFGHIMGIIVSGLVWLIIGCFLTFKGLLYLSQSFISEQTGPFLNLYVKMFEHKEKAAMFLIFTSLIVGVLKGRVVLSKTVARAVKRLVLIPGPLCLRDLFPRSYLFLILGMMSLGMLIKFLPLGFDVKGCIDLAVGSALINGAFLYFKQALLLKTEVMRRKK